MTTRPSLSSFLSFFKLLDTFRLVDVFVFAPIRYNGQVFDTKVNSNGFSESSVTFTFNIHGNDNRPTSVITGHARVLVRHGKWDSPTFLDAHTPDLF